MGLAELQGATDFPRELHPRGISWAQLRDGVCLLISTVLATEDGGEGTLPPALKRNKKEHVKSQCLNFKLISDGRSILFSISILLSVSLIGTKIPCMEKYAVLHPCGKAISPSSQREGAFERGKETAMSL